MKTKAFQSPLLAGLCLLAIAAPGWAAQSSITAQLEPKQIGLGESARLAVTVNGSKSAEPNVPDVDGLEITPVGQQSSIQIINGAVSSTVSRLYRVTPNRAGDFTIPAITAAGVGATRPIAFRVDRGTGGQTQRAPSGYSSKPHARGLREDEESVDANNRSAFLRVVLPKHDLTVGELVPVEVKAYFRADVSATLNGLPMLSSDAFALNEFNDRAEQTRELIDGMPYSVVTWTTSLSAVKAGEYPLNLELPVMVRIQARSNSSQRGGRNPFRDFFGDNSPFGSSMFDDSFFDDFFGGLVEKPLTLRTDGEVVKIKPLPANGRPAGFSGAVGKFDVSGEAAATSGTTGDPMTLKIKVAGEGNFSRVSTDGLPASAEWKSYKPSAQFEPVDSTGTAGEKAFEQSIVPLKARAQEIPALSFSYFDPDEGKYVTKSTQPIPVEIAQGMVTAAPATTQPASTPATDSPATAADGLAANKVVPVNGSSSLQPLIFRPWFIAINAAMLVALAMGAIVRFFGARRANNPEHLLRLATRKAVSESIAAMDAAIQANDAPRFFGAARHALQERLAARWNVPLSRVTISEIHTRMNGEGDAVSTVFQFADEVAYSGRRFTAPDLQQWRDLVTKQLQQLT